MWYGSHFPLNHRAHPKFLPKRTTQRVLEGLPRVAPPRREGPQPSQKPVGGATHQEQRAIRPTEQRRHDVVMRERFLRAFRRDGILEPPEAGGTAGSQRTLPAPGCIRQAYGGAQVHHREGRVTAFPLSHQAGGSFPQDPLQPAGPGIPIDGVEAGDDATRVRVEDRDVRPESDRGDRPGRRSSDPGECHQLLHRPRHFAAVAGDEDPCGPVEVSRAGIVPETLPRLQDGVQFRPGKGSQVGKFEEKAVIVRSDGFDPGLLEHDLRYPDAIRVPRLPPRHRTGRRPEPPQERRGDPRVGAAAFLGAPFHKEVRYPESASEGAAPAAAPPGAIARWGIPPLSTS